MKLSIEHTTTYRYDKPISYALQKLRLTPKSRVGHEVINWETIITGGTKQAVYDDHHANLVELVSFEPGRTEFTIQSKGVVETTDNHGITGQNKGFVPLWLFQRSTDLTKAGNGVKHLLKGFSIDPDDQIGSLHALSKLVLEKVTYQGGATEVNSSAEEVIKAGAGVCQDHAHVFIAAARHLGHPARYVSGYLMMNEVVIQDATHAWVEAYVEGVGWVGFDVSNGISPDERYVRVATGLDYSEAAPISGLMRGGSEEELLVSLQVQQ
ncbi:MAG: transglutaminase family protein [Ahrensia sp.]